MGRVYDANGNKMGVKEICEELVSRLDTDTAKVIADNIGVHCSVVDAVNKEYSQSSFAHAVLDSYKHIDSTTENGQRLRKLMDNLMTKYQKSTASPSADDMKAYSNMVKSIFDLAGISVD